MQEKGSEEKNYIREREETLKIVQSNF